MEPLFFIPFFEEKKWGGSKLATIYGKYSQSINIADCWELSAVQFKQSFVRNGEFVGATLSELFARRKNLFGIEGQYFPFVVKLLEVEKQTPISIHGGGLKDDRTQYEGWYIISADEDSSIMTGTKLKNSKELRSSIKEGKMMETPFLHRPKEGECFLVPPGTPHSVSSGLLMYEISSPLRESSQVFDWEKRDEHPSDYVYTTVKYGEEILPSDPVNVSENIELLLKSDFFVLEKIDAHNTVTLNSEKVFMAFTALQDGVVSGKDFSTNYKAGETFMIPAGNEKFTLSGGTLLRAMPVT